MSGFRMQRLRRWLTLLAKNKLKALKACKEDCDGEGGSENEKKYQAIGFIVAYTAELTRSPEDVQELRMDDFWPEDGYRPKTNDVALMATRFHLDAREGKGARYQQALAWSKVVKYCISKKMNAEEVFDFLCENTIYGAIGLAALEAEVEAEDDILPSSVEGAPRSSTVPADESSSSAPRDGPADVIQADEEKNKRGAGTVSDPSNGSATTNEQRPRRKTIDLENDFVIDPGKHWVPLLRMLKGERVTITLGCTKDDGFKRFIVERVEPVRQARREDD